MNVVFIADELASLGGIQRFVLSLGTELSSHGHNVILVALHDAPGTRLEGDLPYLAIGLPARSPGQRQLAGRAHGEIQSLLEAIGTGVLMLQSPSVVAWMSTVNTAGFRRVAFYHGPYSYAMAHYHRNFLGMHYRDFDDTIFLTAEDAQLLASECGLRNARHLPVAFLTPPKDGLVPIEARPRRVLSVGRLVEDKGFDLAIRAFEQADDGSWTLDILGDGPEAANLLAQARESHTRGHDVRIRGPRTPEQILEEYESAKLLVMGSKSEGFGLVISEAASRGVPTVALDVSAGVRTQIKHGNTGYLVPADHERGFSSRMKELMADAPLRSRMGRAACDYARNLSEGVSVAAWLDFLAE